MAPIPQASVFQHIQARRPLRALQLHVVHVKVRPGSLVVHPYGTRSAALRRKRHAQPHPALVYPCAGLVIDAFALLLRSRDSQSRHLQVHPFSAERRTLGRIHIRRQGVLHPGVQPVCGPGRRHGAVLSRSDPSLAPLFSCSDRFRSRHRPYHHVRVRSVDAAQRPRRAARLKAVVPQLVHRRHSHRCRLQRPVVALLRRPRSAVHRVTGSHQLPFVVRAVCVHRPPGVVENIVCQNVVVCIVGPVIAVVPVFRLSSHQVVHLDHSAYCYAGIRRRRCDFPHGPHLAVPVLQLHPVLRLRVVHIPHPRIQRTRRILCVHSVLRQHTLPTAHLQQLSSAVAQAVHASRRVRHAGQVLAAVIPQARHRDFRSAPILLHNLVDSVPGAARVSVGVLAPVAVDVPDLKLIPVGILHHRQKSVYKILRVVLVIRHFVVVRHILVDLQSQAVLIVVIPVLLLLVLGKVVHRSVSVCVLQIRRRFSRLHIVLQLHLFHLLHHVQVYSGSQVHSVSQPASHVVILRPVLLRIAAVVHQLQAERVHRGCVRSQLLAHRHLSRIIRQVHRSSVPHSVRLIRIIRLDPVGAPVRHHKRHPVIREPRTAFVRRRCVGRQRQSVVAAPVLVPLLCRRCDVPQKNIPDGMVAGVHIVQRRSVGRPVRPAQAAVQILVLRIGVHVQHHLSLRAVAAGSPIVLIQSGIRPHQRMPRRYLRVLVQLEVHLRLLVVPMVSAQDLSSGHGVIHPLGTHRPLKVRFLRLVDQRRIDRHREYSLFCFQPAFLRCHRQHPAAVFLLLQLIPHRLRIRPCPVRHVRRRHPVRGVSFRILQHHRPVLLQRRRQSLQTQPEGEGVSSRQPTLPHTAPVSAAGPV